MTEAKKYTGGCHCGNVRYEVQADLGGDMIGCNCSICGKSGSILTFVPGAHFNLLSGADSLTDYQFAKHHIHHKFCKVCGIRSFAHGAAPDGGEMFAVNVRCLDDVDLQALKIMPFDGKSL
jgi:hypothetical protein